MNLTDLESFVRVVELGTISAAAAAQGVPKSTISRRIARLEDELGVELLRRSARSFALTESGVLLHARSAAALQELGDVERQLTDTSEVPRGRLVLTGPRDVAISEAFARLVEEYRSRYPAVSVEIRLESRYVDLVGEGVDVALRAHQGPIPGDAGLMSRQLGSSAGRFYASPTYVDRRGKPRSITELGKHDLVLHRVMVGRPLTLRAANGEERTLELGDPVVCVDDFQLLQRMAELGCGIALAPELAVSRALHSQALVPVLPKWSLQFGRLSLVWPASRHLAPRVRSFVDLATQRLQGSAWIET